MSSSIKANPKQCFTKNKVFGFALFGGGGENRTPVRKTIPSAFSGRSASLRFPSLSGGAQPDRYGSF